MTAVEQAAESFRRAIQASCFGEAQHLLDEYARAVNAVLAERGPQDDRSMEAVRHALDLMQWAGRVVRSGRAHATMELARLSAGRPYLAPAGKQAATVQLVG
jgi:hypothetical protein